MRRLRRGASSTPSSSPRTSDPSPLILPHLRHIHIAHRCHDAVCQLGRGDDGVHIGLVTPSVHIDVSLEAARHVGGRMRGCAAARLVSLLSPLRASPKVYPTLSRNSVHPPDEEESKQSVPHRETRAARTTAPQPWPTVSLQHRIARLANILHIIHIIRIVHTDPSHDVKRDPGHLEAEISDAAMPRCR